jgi:uncharacterized damage-inducible protein DinB
MTDSTQPSPEVADLLDTLADHRRLLLRTLDGITDDEARMRTTVSELCLGGIIKHLTEVEIRWTNFIEEGPSAMGSAGPDSAAAHAATFVVDDDETLQGLLDAYEEVARRTGALLASLPTLDVAQPLPKAPWFEAGASWTARRTMLHLLAEMAQHAGHADIIREALDGQKTMG